MALKKTVSQAIFIAVMMLIQVDVAIASEIPRSAELASIQKPHLMIDVRSECTSEGAVFSIVNRGEKWPQPAMLKLINVENKKIISERRLRLANQQRLSFIVRDKINNGYPLAIWVDPQWYTRPFEFDAQRDCNIN